MTLIPRDKIVAFLDSHDVKAQCEVCGHSDGWILPDTDKDRIVGLFNPREDGGYLAPGAVTPAIIAVCKHCTHIRFFAEVAMNFLLEKETPSDGKS